MSDYLLQLGLSVIFNNLHVIPRTGETPLTVTALYNSALYGRFYELKS